MITVAQLETLAREQEQAHAQHTQGLLTDQEYQNTLQRFQEAVKQFNAQNQPHTPTHPQKG